MTYGVIQAADLRQLLNKVGITVSIAKAEAYRKNVNDRHNYLVGKTNKSNKWRKLFFLKPLENPTMEDAKTSFAEVYRGVLGNTSDKWEFELGYRAIEEHIKELSALCKYGNPINLSKEDARILDSWLR